MFNTTFNFHPSPSSVALRNRGSQEKFEVCNVHAGVMALCYGTVNAKSTCGTS
jgi:hypothetical protein